MIIPLTIHGTPDRVFLFAFKHNEGTMLSAKINGHDMELCSAFGSLPDEYGRVSLYNASQFFKSSKIISFIEYAIAGGRVQMSENEHGVDQGHGEVDLVTTEKIDGSYITLSFNYNINVPIHIHGSEIGKLIYMHRGIYFEDNRLGRRLMRLVGCCYTQQPTLEGGVGYYDRNDIEDKIIRGGLMERVKQGRAIRVIDIANGKGDVNLVISGWRRGSLILYFDNVD